ncbi:MAG: hypothetical protein OXQ92_07255 [Boseongicola sp.]|nr:hypothetical protein [Boseongicola sp.]
MTPLKIALTAAVVSLALPVHAGTAIPLLPTLDFGPASSQCNLPEKCEPEK